MNRRTFILSSLAGAISLNLPRLGRGQPASSTAPARELFLTDIPSYAGNVLLARPTHSSITLNVCLVEKRDVRVVYGPPGGRSQRSDAISLKAGEPREIVLNKLSGGAEYEYQLVDSQSGKAVGIASPRGTFRTGRAPGEEFTFTIQADSHLDEGCRTDIYQNTLQNQLADKPDFMIDMGDTSMAGKHPDRTSAFKQYLAQRYYFGLIGHSVPSFLVIGNHDGEEAKIRGATDAGGLAVWSSAQRKRYFSNPVPDDFYTGNERPHPQAGLLQNYYAWTWGDVLLVVLDPYWTSTASRGAGGGWHMSLGKRQYDWLARTLRASKAKHKLVIIHQLVGGLDNGGRGGAEAAACFEWGGHEIDGRNTFATNRPDWAMPVHQLLVDAGVKAVFHGHDHFFAEQRKDGILYQLVPQPAQRNYRNDHAAEYGYREGKFLPNSGHLRAHIGRDGISCSYIRSVPEAMQRGSLRNGHVEATTIV